MTSPTLPPELLVERPADPPPSVSRTDEARREWSFRAVAIGAVLGVVFGLVTVYIALRVGLNFSASIPIAVLAITVLRRLGRPSILEQNIVQTVGSAGESIAAGAVYTFPALLFLGFSLELWRVFWLAFVGGVLGVLFMVPLRRQLVARSDAELVYPEGVACAEILSAGERGGAFARPVFWGLGVGALYKGLMSGLRVWPAALSWTLSPLRGAMLSVDLSPELLGIGCLIGLPVARVLFAGSVMAALVFVPLIYFFGSALPAPLFPSTVPIDAMSPGDIWSSYIRYIGAGGVIAGGTVLLWDALPTMWQSLARIRQAPRPPAAIDTRQRSEQDLPTRQVVIGIIAMLVCLYAVLALRLNPHGAGNVISVLLVAIFGFFFVTVSARITGLMGSSANPISGITIAVVTLTCFLFVAAGWVGRPYEIVAVSIGAVVCIAASNAGTTAQDLKTGWLLGASPQRQQIGLVVGVLTSVLVIGVTLIWFTRNGQVGTPELPAPQAQVMALLVDGLLTGRMRWPLLLAGVMIAVVLELCGVRSLPFAVGVYLPLSATAALLIGALIARHAPPREALQVDDPFRPGMLYSSGLIAGGAIAAIGIAVLASSGLLDGLNLGARWPALTSPLLAAAAFLVLCALVWRAHAATPITPARDDRSEARG